MSLAEPMQERPLRLRDRYPRLVVHVPAALFGTALAAVVEVGVLHGQWHDGRAFVVAGAGILFYELLAKLAGDALERGAERYATERTFSGLELPPRSRPKRRRSHDR